LFHPAHFHHFGHHADGAHRAFAFAAIAKILIIFFAFILAVVARYAVSQWALREYDDELKANAAGWLAFLAVLLALGIVALKAF
jgi:hypothetical protein